MVINKKFLGNYEQSMLLVAMLFARKHLDSILSFFPDEQRALLETAMQRLLRLEQSERITQIIFELKRLLLVEEYSIDWIHESWINDKLDKEPIYLKNIIKKELTNTNQSYTHIIPRAVIKQSFKLAFINTTQKVALFDPVLMRLQSIKNNTHAELITKVGSYMLGLLATSLNTQRLIKFINRRHSNLKLNIIDNQEEIFNPIKNIILQQIIHTNSHNNLPLNIGILIIALYLSCHNQRWQRALLLALPKTIAADLSQYLAQHAKLTIEADEQARLATLIKAGMDQEH